MNKNFLGLKQSVLGCSKLNLCYVNYQLGTENIVFLQLKHSQLIFVTWKAHKTILKHSEHQRECALWSLVRLLVKVRNPLVFVSECNGLENLRCFFSERN